MEVLQLSTIRQAQSVLKFLLVEVETPLLQWQHGQPYSFFAGQIHSSLETIWSSFSWSTLAAMAWLLSLRRLDLIGCNCGLANCSDCSAIIFFAGTVMVCEALNCHCNISTGLTTFSPQRQIGRNKSFLTSGELDIWPVKVGKYQW